MVEVRGKLKSLGQNIKGHINLGIRPSKRNKGYATKVIETVTKKMKDNGVNEVIICCNSEDVIIPEILKNQNFVHYNILKFNNRKISCYTKTL